MKVLSFLFILASTIFAQDTTNVISISNDIYGDAIIFAERDSAQYLRIYFVGDSIKADYDRMNPDKAVQEFFQLVAAARYRTTANFFVGDTVTAIYDDGFERKGTVAKESESGRLLIEFRETSRVGESPYTFKKWFYPSQVEAYIP